MSAAAARARRVRAGWSAALCAGLALGLGLGCGGSTRATRPAWELPPPAPSERPVVREGALTRLDLDNGLRVLVLEDHRLPRVTLSIVLRRGAAGESLEQAGVAILHGRAPRARRRQARRARVRRGRRRSSARASLPAPTGTRSRFRSRGLSRDSDALFDLLADAALRPRFDRREAVRAHDELLAALERAKDDPATLARWHAAQAIYAGHRFARRSRQPQTAARLDAAARPRLHARAISSQRRDLQRSATSIATP